MQSGCQNISLGNNPYQKADTSLVRKLSLVGISKYQQEKR